MRRLITLSVLLLYSLSGFSQNVILRDGTLPFDSTTSVLINIQGDRFDQSNALTREFYQKLAFGGYLSEDSKQGVDKGLKTTNNYGGGMHPGISIAFLRDSAKYGFTVAYQYTQLSNAQFSDDLFNLIFRGNSYFGSDPANLTDTKYTNQNYQHIDFGLIDKKTGSFLNIGIYDGIKYQNISVDDASFLTLYNSIGGISYAEEVSLMAENLLIEESDNSSTPFKNGFGIGINAAYNLNTDIGFFSAEIQDLGLMSWNIEQSDTSGTFRFQGFNWNPDEDRSEGGIIENLKDSLQISSTRESSWLALPGKISLRYVSPTDGKYFAAAALRYYYSLGYFPELTVSANMKYGERNVFWLSANAGGYNYFDIGVGTQIQFFERSFLTLGTRNLSGLFMNNGHAESVFIQFMLKI